MAEGMDPANVIKVADLEMGRWAWMFLMGLVRSHEPFLPQQRLFSGSIQRDATVMVCVYMSRQSLMHSWRVGLLKLAESSVCVWFSV